MHHFPNPEPLPPRGPCYRGLLRGPFEGCRLVISQHSASSSSRLHCCCFWTIPLNPNPKHMRHCCHSHWKFQICSILDKRHNPRQSVAVELENMRSLTSEVVARKIRIRTNDDPFSKEEKANDLV